MFQHQFMIGKPRPDTITDILRSLSFALSLLKGRNAPIWHTRNQGFKSSISDFFYLNKFISNCILLFSGPNVIFHPAFAFAGLSSRVEIILTEKPSRCNSLLIIYFPSMLKHIPIRIKKKICIILIQIV